MSLKYCCYEYLNVISPMEDGVKDEVRICKCGNKLKIEYNCWLQIENQSLQDLYRLDRVSLVKNPLIKSYGLQEVVGV